MPRGCHCLAAMGCNICRSARAASLPQVPCTPALPTLEQWDDALCPLPELEQPTTVGSVLIALGRSVVPVPQPGPAADSLDPGPQSSEASWESHRLTAHHLPTCPPAELHFLVSIYTVLLGLLLLVTCTPRGRYTLDNPYRCALRHLPHPRASQASETQAPRACTCHLPPHRPPPQCLPCPAPAFPRLAQGGVGPGAPRQALHPLAAGHLPHAALRGVHQRGVRVYAAGKAQTALSFSCDTAPYVRMAGHGGAMAGAAEARGIPGGLPLSRHASESPWWLSTHLLLTLLGMMRRQSLPLSYVEAPQRHWEQLNPVSQALDVTAGVRPAAVASPAVLIWLW